RANYPVACRGPRPYTPCDAADAAPGPLAGRRMPVHKGGCTMRIALSMLAGLAIVCALALTATAEDKKEAKDVKLTGTLVCGKCALKETDECSNVVQVKDGDKTVNYYIK